MAPDVANGHRPLESLLYTAQLLPIFFCTGADCAGRRAETRRAPGPPPELLNSGVPEHALDALGVGFEPHVLVEVHHFTVCKECDVADVPLEQSTDHFLHECFTKTLTLE